MFIAALLTIAKICPKYTQNWQSWRGKVGVLQTARLKVEFGREDYTIVQVLSQRVAELYFWQKKWDNVYHWLQGFLDWNLEISVYISVYIPVTFQLHFFSLHFILHYIYCVLWRCPEVAWSCPGLISAGTPPSGRSRHLAESSESDSKAGMEAVQRTMKINGAVLSRLSEKKISLCAFKDNSKALLNQGSQTPEPWTGYWFVTC